MCGKEYRNESASSASSHSSSIFSFWVREERGVEEEKERESGGEYRNESASSASSHSSLTLSFWVREERGAEEERERER